MDTSGLIRKEEGEEYSSTVELSSFFCEGDWLYYTGMVYMGTPYAVAGRMSLETGEKQGLCLRKPLEPRARGRWYPHGAGV